MVRPQRGIANTIKYYEENYDFHKYQILLDLTHSPQVSFVTLHRSMDDIIVYIFNCVNGFGFYLPLTPFIVYPFAWSGHFFEKIKRRHSLTLGKQKPPIGSCSKIFY